MKTRRFLGTVEDIAEAVRSERAVKHLSQDALAQRAGVGRRFVADLEAGHPRAELEKVLQVLDALDIHALALPSAPKAQLDIDAVDLDEVLYAYQR